MAQYLDKTGLTTLWNKIKNTFALKSHTHTKSQIKDFPTIPTVNNPTITINQGGTKKGSFSLNQSGATTIDLTDNNTTYSAGTGLSLSSGVFSVKTGYTNSGKNYKVTTDNDGNLYVNVPWNNDTWRPVVDNLTTTDATKSLSANQGKVLKDLVDGKAASSHTHTSLNTSFVFNNSDMAEGSANLSATATAHKTTFYRNGLSIPYQMDNANDGGILRCRGTSESNVIFELGTWDDSGAGETIQFNYYPTTSQVTPTYSVSVPKKSGTIALTSDIPTSLPASDVYAWAKASSKPSYTKSEVGLGNVDNTADANKSVNYATSSHLLRTYSVNNGSHGADYYLKCRHNVDGNDRFKLQIIRSDGSVTHSTSVDYANSAGSVAWGNVSGRPSSLPASDVYSWAKASTKPSYTASEVGAASSGHTHDGRYIRWNGSAADVSSMGWGTLTAANGYTILSHCSSSDGGDWGMVNKNGQISMQLDGYYYQNEGKYRVLDTSNISMSFSNGVLTITYNS